MQAWVREIKDRAERTATQISQASNAFTAPEHIGNGDSAGMEDRQRLPDKAAGTKGQGDGNGAAGMVRCFYEGKRLISPDIIWVVISLLNLRPSPFFRREVLAAHRSIRAQEGGYAATEQRW